MTDTGGKENSLDTGLQCLVMMARLNGLPADASQIKHQFVESGAIMDTLSLLRAAKQLGMKAKHVSTTFSKLKKLNLPAIAISHDGRYFIIAKISEQNQLLIQDPSEQQPLLVNEDIFLEKWCGEVILLTHREGLIGKTRHFDFAWFIPAMVKYRKLLGEVLLASFFLQLFALITPLFFQVVIDKVLVHRGLTTLDVLAFGLIVVSIFDVVLSGLRTYVFSHTTNRIDIELGASLFRHLIALPLSYFEARRVGDSVARVRELENIRNFLTGSSVTVLVDLFFTVVFFAVMYYYSPTLTYVVLGAIPFYILLSILITPVLRQRLNEKFNKGAENQAFLVESVSGMETLKAMAVEPQMQRRWEEQLSAYVKASFKAQMLGNIANQTASLVNKIMTVLILWFGAHLVITNQLSVGQLIAFNMLAGRVSGPILRMVQLWQDFQQAGISVQRLGDILNTKSESQYNPNRVSLPNPQGRVSFDHVSFRYQPDIPEVLNTICLDVHAGEMIGIVGRSGSGKSTLTKLIQRLYVPESGRVLVDGVDLASVDITWLRSNVGVVLQENFLFNRSIRDNIALSDPGMPMEQIIQAAKTAGAHDFILELPAGYDNQVGEHGCNLSGGQRQRIAIARALVTRPKVLIFDEATSALDYESERVIQDNMQEICRDRTVFIIAHRLSTVRQCQRIIVIDKGRIVEQGTHDELMQLNAEYAHLYSLQAGANNTAGKSKQSSTGISVSWQQQHHAKPKP